MGAFNPLSRIHHEGNVAVEPWLFGEEEMCIRDRVQPYQADSRKDFSYKFGDPGKVTARTETTELGVTQLTLSNGVQMCIRDRLSGTRSNAGKRGRKQPHTCMEQARGCLLYTSCGPRKTEIPRQCPSSLPNGKYRPSLFLIPRLPYSWLCLLYTSTSISSRRRIPTPG